MEVDITFLPIGRDVDITAIDSDGIGFRKYGRLRMACLEFITVIGVYGHSISLYFPVARNLDIIPGVSAHGRIGDIGRKIFVTVCKEELPGAVQ